MRGFNTDSIFTAAYHAQQFANNQLEMAYAAIQERGQREFEKKYAKARTKLEDVHAAYSKERARRQEMMKALNASKTKQKEIYRKYEQVCGQKRRLEQMYSELRRSHGVGGANAIHKRSFSNEELRGADGGPHLLDEDPFGDTPMRDSGGRRGSMGNPVRRSLRTHSPVPMRSLDSLNDSHGEVTTKAMEAPAPPVMNTNKIPSFGQNNNNNNINNNKNNNNDRRRSSFGINATNKGGGFAPGLAFGSKPQYNKVAANPFASKQF